MINERTEATDGVADMISTNTKLFSMEQQRWCRKNFSYI